MGVKTGNVGLDKYLADTGLDQAKEKETAAAAEEVVEDVVLEEEEELEEEVEEVEAELEEEIEEEEVEEEEEFEIILEDDEEITTPEVGTVNYAELSKTLQFDISSDQDVVSAFDTLKKNAAELEEKLTQVQERSSNIPDALQKAIDINEQGGDYLAYFDLESQKKYVESSNAKELYTNYLAEQSYFKGQEEPREALRDFIEGENPVSFQINADTYKEGLLKQTSDEIANRATAAQVNKDKAVMAARNAVNALDNIHGVKVGAKAKKQLIQDFESGDFTNKLLYDSEGKADYTKMARLSFLNDNFEKIMDIVSTGSKNKTKRGMINQVANKSTNKGDKVTTKSSKSADPLQAFKEQMMKTGGMGR